VNEATMLVTSDGKHILPESDKFFIRLRDLAPGHDAADFAVRRLGFIKLQLLDRRVGFVELQPQNVDQRALAAAERWIGEHSGARFLIKRPDLEARAQIAISPEDAIAQLRALCAASAETASTERFSAEPQDFAKLLRNHGDPMSLFGHKWCGCSAAFDVTMLPFAEEHAMLPSLILVGVSKRQTDPVFRFIGERLFPWLAPGYRTQAIGERVESFPDKDFGAWVSGFYRSVARSGEPRFDQVRAQIQVEGEPGRTYATRYERLLLPWQSASGETLVSLFVRKLDDADGRAQVTTPVSHSTT
jgi:hypothetical protein